MQSYHWNQQQCIVYPAWHTTCKITTSCRGHFALSDELTHDSVFMLGLLCKLTMLFISLSQSIDNLLRRLKLNLCNCKCDFNNEAWWSFFATSHGKFPCDDLGETVKQAKIASSQRPMSDQIMTIQALFEYCCENISGIQFELLHSDDFQKVQPKMASRFLLGSTIPRTYFFQYFEPPTISSIGYK